MDLQFVPKSEFRRLATLSLPRPQQTALFAALCRINVLYMIMRAGSGHIGTSFSSLDLVAWLFLNELRLPTENDAGTPRDIYFSSKGHDVPGLYAVLTALDLLPFDRIHQLRRLGGLPGHPDISVPFMETNTGSLGMGISKARGMALANRLQGTYSRIYVLTGDGELQEGQFWESLLPTANVQLGELTVIVDHNKIQSDTWVSRVSDLGDLEARLRANNWYVARCDGHDLKAVASTLAACKTVSDRPKIVIADTVKGKGVSFMEHTAMAPEARLYRFHSGAPDVELYARAIAELVATADRQLEQAGAASLASERVTLPDRRPAEGAQRMIPAYSRALVAHAERNPHVVALDADLALDCGLLAFEERFPDRFFECGIAEQDMVSQAGGMALKGLVPVVHSFACFLSSRPNEQIYNNASERTKVIYVGSLAGLLPGGPGHSHQCVRDISSLGAVPGLILLEPSCEEEVSLAVDFCLNRTVESCYLRLVSIPCEVPYTLPAGYGLEFGKGVTLTEGADAVLFGYGPVLLPQAFKAALLLRERHGVGLRVVNLPWLNRVDPDWLAHVVADCRWIFTLDNHYTTGGQGSMILSQLAQLDLARPLQARCFGVTDIPRCGQNDEVLRAHGLDADSLAEKIANAVANS